MEATERRESALLADPQPTAPRVILLADTDWRDGERRLTIPAGTVGRLLEHPERIADPWERDAALTTLRRHRQANRKAVAVNLAGRVRLLSRDLVRIER